MPTKTKVKQAQDFTLAADDNALKDETQKDQVYGLGEEPHERDARHVIQVGQQPGLVLNKDPEKQVEFGPESCPCLNGDHSIQTSQGDD